MMGQATGIPSPVPESAEPAPSTGSLGAPGDVPLSTSRGVGSSSSRPPTISAGPMTRSDPAPVAVREPGPLPQTHEQVRMRTQSDAFGAIVDGIRTLAIMRGHSLGMAVRDSRWGLTIPCSRCDRWVTVSLDPTTGSGLATADLGITGYVLAVCPGTPWGKPAADDERQTNYMADATRSG